VVLHRFEHHPIGPFSHLGRSDVDSFSLRHTSNAEEKW